MNPAHLHRDPGVNVVHFLLHEAVSNAQGDRVARQKLSNNYLRLRLGPPHPHSRCELPPYLTGSNGDCLSRSIELKAVKRS